MKQLSILIVDDEPEILDVFEDCLIEAFPKTQNLLERAGDGQQALKKLAEKPYDLVVADLKMPHCTGTELVHSLRSSSLENKDIPIVIVSGYISTHRTEKIQNIFYITKPFQFNRLVKMFRLVMAGQESGNTTKKVG